MIIGRRGFLVGLGSLLAAPAIVHAGNLMPVRASKAIIRPSFDLVVHELIDGNEVVGDYARLDGAFEPWSLNGKFDPTQIRRTKYLNSITSPWDKPDYGLRDDLYAAFAEHGK